MKLAEKNKCGEEWKLTLYAENDEEKKLLRRIKNLGVLKTSILCLGEDNKPECVVLYSEEKIECEKCGTTLKTKRYVNE